MKKKFFTILSLSLLGCTNVFAILDTTTTTTTTPWQKAEPVTIVNDHASAQAEANANVTFTDQLATQKITPGRIDRGGAGGRLITPTTYTYTPVSQHVVNSGNANNDQVLGTSSDSTTTLYASPN